jgi:integrase
MRIGEALAVTSNDIDFGKGKYAINKTLAYNGKITPPKTESSNRTIAIPSSTNQQIESIFRKLGTESGRIFPTTYSSARYHYRKAINISKVRPLQMHCLRHAHASLLIAQGVPITAISKRLGHTSPKITLSIYSHAMHDSDENIAALLDTL